MGHISDRKGGNHSSQGRSGTDEAGSENLT